ncbi:hypothetical protein GCK32_003718 [Trichostrongylus colubriformis]|uniref:Uncharacterized protein n=1 Tax=Trichostrongylus colubriformis TaxID=6319 RepID=A0AAN8G7P6_TRICO
MVTEQRVTEIQENSRNSERPRNNDEPLLIDCGAIESALSDQLQLLDGLRSSSQELPTAFEEEEKEERVSFEAEVRQATQCFQNMVDVFETFERHPFTHSTTSNSTQNKGDITEENAEYMESVEEPQVDEEKTEKTHPKNNNQQWRRYQLMT